MINTPQRKLGKLPPRIDHRTFKLAKYLPAPLPAPPAEVSWVTHVPNWPMMLNDQLGDCTCACAGHMIQQWSFYAGKPFVPSDADVLRAYEAVGGYIPGQPDTDQGAVILDVLNYWRKQGIGGHKILAYMAIDWTNDTEVKQAIQLFGSIYVGVQLPISAQSQSAWTIPDGGAVGNGAPGSWGGHAIPIMAASPMSRTCITWGERMKMSPNFFKQYCDEAYVVLSEDWIEKNGLAPSSFNLAQLEQDLKAL